MTDIATTELSEAELREKILSLSAVYADRFHSKKEFVADESAVPVSGKVIDASEMRNLVSSSLDFWLTAGRYNTMFEQRMKKILQRKAVLTCNSGSSANLLALSALTSPILGEKALKPGDEVITCATGFPTTVNPILNNQLVPVFLDVDIPTYNMVTEHLEAAITPKTRAIMLAHTLGNPFDLDTVMKVAKKHDLFVIEDTCDALGGTFNDQLVGTFGDVATLSFYPAHHITMGEGGAVYCDNKKIMRAAESMRDWGRDCWCPAGEDNTCGQRFEWQLGDLPKGFDHKYTYSHVGYNLKVTDMQAAIGLAQLDKLEGFIADRRANFAYLKAALAEMENYFILPEALPQANPSWFGFPLTVRPDAGFSRDDLVVHLNEKKIGTRLLFGGNLLKQPYLKDVPYKTFGDITNADTVMNDTFWVGVYPGLEQPELNYMIDTISKFVTGRTRG